MSLNLILLVVLVLVLETRSQCSSDEFSFQGTQCLKCSSFVPACSSCVSGQYSELINGSFELPSLDDGLVALFVDPATVPGWTAQAGRLIEIDTSLWFPSQAGNQYLQIAEDHNYYVYQDVVTEPGYDYQIQFYYSAIPGHDSVEQTTHIYWGEDLYVIAPDGTGIDTTDWMLFTSPVSQATQSYTRLKIEGVGVPDLGFGALIDNISYKNLPTCSYCFSGFYLSGNSCFACSDLDEECVRCSRECEECSKGFYVKEGKCEKCDESCETCSETGKCLNCKDGYFLEIQQGEEGSCLSCFHTCSKCDSSLCTECRPSLSLVNGACVCLDGDFLTEEGCLTCKSFDEECSECDSQGCTECSFNFVLHQGTCLSPHESKQNNDDNEENKEEEAQRNKQVIEGISTSSLRFYTTCSGLVASVSISLLSGNPSSLWLLLNLEQVIFFVPLMDTSMSEAMKEYCKALASSVFGIVPNFGEMIGLEEEDYEENSDLWKDYDIATSSFFLNSGESVFYFLLSLCVFPVICMLYVLFCLNRRVMRVIREYKWNFFLRSWVQLYLELLVFSLLNLKHIRQDKIDLEEIASLLIFCLALCTPLLLICFLYKNRKNIETKEIFGRCSLFYELVGNKGAKGMAFYLLFFCRRMSLGISLFLLEGHGLTQVVLNLALSASIIVYLVRIRPFKRRSVLFLNVISEMCLFVVFCVSGMCLYITSEEDLKILGYIFVGCLFVTMFLFLSTGLFLAIKRMISIKKTQKIVQYSSNEEQITIINTKPYKTSREHSPMYPQSKSETDKRRVVSEIVN